MTPTDRVAELHGLDRCDHDQPLTEACPGCSAAVLACTTSEDGRSALRMSRVFGNGTRLPEGTAPDVLRQLVAAGYAQPDLLLTGRGEVAAAACTTGTAMPAPAGRRSGATPIEASQDEPEPEHGKLYLVRGYDIQFRPAGYLVVAARPLEAVNHAITYAASPLVRVTDEPNAPGAPHVQDVTEAAATFRRMVAETPYQDVDVVAHRLRLFATDTMLVDLLAWRIRAEG